MGKIQTWLVLPDIHIPDEDKQSIAAVENLMRDYRFDGCIYLGDILSFDCISSHNIGNLRAVEGTRILADYDKAAALLDRHAAILRKKNKNCKIIFIEGNHEHRITRYIDAHPQMEGMVEVPIALELKRRGIVWVPYWSEGEVYKVGAATFIHGRYVNNGHAKKHVTNYGCSVFYGHTHSIDSYSLPRYEPGSHIGQSLGCLCLPQKYMRGAPDKWHQAIALFQFGADGNFDYHGIRIIEHRLG
jgi:predicted phosphodiesterase